MRWLIVTVAIFCALLTPVSRLKDHGDQYDMVALPFCSTELQINHFPSIVFEKSLAVAGKIISCFFLLDINGRWNWTVVERTVTKSLRTAWCAWINQKTRDTSWKIWKSFYFWQGNSPSGIIAVPVNSIHNSARRLVFAVRNRLHIMVMYLSVAFREG